MATTAGISVEQYLRTGWRPDRELIGGQLKQKPLPSRLHSFVQVMLGHWFSLHMDEWGLTPMSEVRTKVTAENVRLPDLAVALGGFSPGKALTEPPLIAIEILSDSDTLADHRDRASDLAKMGVPNIWLIDAEKRSAFVWSGSGAWQPTEQPSAAGTPIYLDLAWLWDKLGSTHL